MNFQLNLITLALLSATTIFPAQATPVQSYGLAQANTAQVKFDKWSCKACKIKQGHSGWVGTGISYQDQAHGELVNQLNSDTEFAGQVSADLNYRTQSQRIVHVSADQLGMDNSRAALSVNHAGHYQAQLSYQQITDFDTSHGFSPYQNIGSGQLTLPATWQAQATTEQMQGFERFELSQQRQIFAFNLDYHANQQWANYLEYRHQLKDGVQGQSGYLGGSSIMLPSPVDYQTDDLKLGLKFTQQQSSEQPSAQWLVDINYQVSQFDNQIEVLQFDNAFTPSFGAQTQGQLTLAPDNKMHQFNLAANYASALWNIQGRTYYGQMTQDQGFNTLGYYAQLPRNTADTEVQLTGIETQASYRLNRKFTLYFDYDYSKRDNRTQISSWEQITLVSGEGELEMNVPYDYQQQRVALEVDYRLQAGLKLQTGYQFKQDKRDYQQREQTEEKTLFAGVNYSALEQWDFRFKASHALRDGAEFVLTTNNDSYVSAYHLADRDRSQVQLQVSHTPTQAVSVDLTSRYAIDDYSKTFAGLTELTDHSTDLSLAWQAAKQLHLSSFIGYQRAQSEQNGHQAVATSAWQSQIEDEFFYVGFSSQYQPQRFDRLTLGLDYNYSDSRSDTVVYIGQVGGVHGQYGDYSSTTHQIDLYGDYQLNAQTQLRLGYRFVDQQQQDPAYHAGINGISNVLTFGDLYRNQDEDAHQVQVNVSYQF